MECGAVKIRARPYNSFNVLEGANLALYAINQTKLVR